MVTCLPYELLDALQCELSDMACLLHEVALAAALVTWNTRPWQAEVRLLSRHYDARQASLMSIFLLAGAIGSSLTLSGLLLRYYSRHPIA